MPLVQPTAAQVAQLISNLCPTGDAWPTEPDSVQQQTFAAFAQTVVRLHALLNTLPAEAFPPTTDVMLPEWEDAEGLPDPCAGPEPTFELRRMSVVSKFVATGGQSIPYFTAVAAALGYSITVTEFAPSRFGRSFGRSFGGPAWAHTWRVTVAGLHRVPFSFGQGRFGEPFSSWGSRVLECTLNRIKPAHTLLQYAYVGVHAVGTWDLGGWDRDGWAT